MRHIIGTLVFTEWILNYVFSTLTSKREWLTNLDTFWFDEKNQSKLLNMKWIGPKFKRFDNFFVKLQVIATMACNLTDFYSKPETEVARQLSNLRTEFCNGLFSWQTNSNLKKQRISSSNCTRIVFPQEYLFSLITSKILKVRVKK